MPRTRKSGADKIADILAKFNIQTEAPIEVPEANYNSNNALAMFAKVPEHFVLGECMECGSKFAHNQPIPAGTRVGYCGDPCRKRAFEKSTGIKWGSVASSREPWDGDPPMIITPEQFANLQKIADWFSRNQTTLEIAAPEESSLLHRDVSTLPVQEYPEDFPFPRDQAVVLDPADLILDESASSEQVSQYLEEARTNPQPSPEPVVSERKEPVDAIFDFE